MNCVAHGRLAIWATLLSICLIPQVQAEGVPSFTNDVIPVLSRFGCNSGGCHGKLAGQNGFKLSLRGYAPDSDFESLARESQGRRINAVAPNESLLIRKAVGALPHGGGKRIAVGSPAEKVLLDWIQAGTPGPKAGDPVVERLEIEPLSTTLKLSETRPILVTAIYSDGQKRDVTWLTQFASSNSGILEVSEAGTVQALRHGEAVIRASFQGQVGVATFTMPHETATQPEWYTARNNVIDDHVYSRLATLRIEPSPLCDDATFLRRASLDAIGTLPTPDEVRAFLADTTPDKRSKLIDSLLTRPEFIDYWALQLGDLLQNRKERDHDVRGTKGVRAMHQWLRQQLLANRSWREIASDVILAEGANTQNPAVGYFIVTVGEKNSEESEVADSVAQAFLGTRIGCARCHNHPLEKYTQDDYYHFVAFFSRIALDRKNPTEGSTTLQVGTRHMQNLQREIEGQQRKFAELQVAAGDHVQELAEVEKRIADLRLQIDAARMGTVETRQPRTGQQLKAQPLDRSVLESPPGEDPRKPLVRWMTDPQNEQFSGAMVNRLWKHFFAVGLVEPVDDLRATNPPSNRELWTYLNQEFVSHNYDLRHVMRLVMNSRAYQLSSETRPSNFRDDRFYSHHYARRLPAEVLLDAICFATGDPEQFPSYPLGVRAIQVPDPGTDSYFLTLFGRSERTTACACERSGDVTLPQLLHLQNSDGLANKLKISTGRLEQLLAAQADNDRVVDELYLSTVSRWPTETEREVVRQSLAGADRREVFQDLFWALLNSKEFAFQH
jgi:hypothetical protein